MFYKFKNQWRRQYHRSGIKFGRRRSAKKPLFESQEAVLEANLARKWRAIKPTRHANDTTWRVNGPVPTVQGGWGTDRQRGPPSRQRRQYRLNLAPENTFQGGTLEEAPNALAHTLYRYVNTEI